MVKNGPAGRDQYLSDRFGSASLFVAGQPVYKRHHVCPNSPNHKGADLANSRVGWQYLDLPTLHRLRCSPPLRATHHDDLGRPQWNYTPTYQGQVKQLTRVLLLLARDYQVHDLNVVAHSYGGTEWLHAYIANPQLQRQLNFHRVILLGVPTDESFGAKTKYTQTLFKRSVDPEFLKLTHQIQTAHLGSDDYLYNWMGQTQPGTDGEVPIVQSEMLRSLIKNKHVHYHQRIFPATNHIHLHQKPTILRQICQVLWGKGNG